MKSSTGLNNPCGVGWVCDLRFYVGTAKQYVEMFKTATDPYSKRVWLGYAERAIEAAEEQIEKIERRP